MWNQPQDPTLHLFSCLSSCHHLLQYFFGAHPKQVSSLHHPSTFVHALFNQWPAAFKVHLNTPYSWGHLHQKKSLCTLWWCLWWLFQALPLFSYSFDRVYSTFLQVLTETSCSFIMSCVTLRQVKKVFLASCLHLKKSIIISTCYIVGFVHWCIYTLQHISENDIFTLFVDRIDL